MKTDNKENGLIIKRTENSFHNMRKCLSFGWDYVEQ